jgi:hypothetical protein
MNEELEVQRFTSSSTNKVLAYGFGVFFALLAYGFGVFFAQVQHHPNLSHFGLVPKGRRTKRLAARFTKQAQ